MSRLENINLSSNEVYTLMNREFFSCGGESVICKTSSYKTLYKIFTKSGLIPTTMSENKLRKLEKIHEMQLEHCTIPLRTITCDKKLIGYEMTYDPNEIRYYPSDFSQEAVIRQLKEIRNILTYFFSKGIIYGDVAFRNILFNRQNGEIKFCDIDNISIDDYPMDLIPPRLRDYADIRGIDENTDAYMHNLLVLDSIGIENLKKQAMTIIDTMKEPENFQGEYIIKYVKRRR